jgi:hypothetical protein
MSGCLNPAKPGLWIVIREHLALCFRTGLKLLHSLCFFLTISFAKRSICFASGSSGAGRGGEGIGEEELGIGDWEFA